MTMKKSLSPSASFPAVILFAGVFLFSCTGREQASRDEADRSPGIQETLSSSLVVAEEIVYDVEVINPYPEDTWMAESLQSLDHESLVKFVFDGIYQERFICYDIFEGTPVPLRKIRKMEKDGEFSRDRIGKFQFQEQWILDTVNMTFSKKVTEIRMGVQKFNDAGELTGYAPLLRVVLY